MTDFLCYNCGIDKGQVYLADKKWLCADCYESLLKEKLPTRKAERRINKINDEIKRKQIKAHKRKGRKVQIRQKKS